MPLFEYECRDCGHSFEAFVTAHRAAGCPACQGVNLTKLLSRPGMVGASTANGRPEAAVPAGGCGAGGAACPCRAAAFDH